MLNHRLEATSWEVGPHTNAVINSQCSTGGPSVNYVPCGRKSEKHFYVADLGTWGTVVICRCLAKHSPYNKIMHSAVSISTPSIFSLPLPKDLAPKLKTSISPFYYNLTPKDS